MEIKKAPMVRRCSIKRRSLTRCTDALKKGNGQRRAEKGVVRKSQTVQKVRNIIIFLFSLVSILKKVSYMFIITSFIKDVSFNLKM